MRIQVADEFEASGLAGIGTAVFRTELADQALVAAVASSHPGILDVRRLPV